MENTKEVNTTLGIWVIKKPKAGIRNRAVMKAETDTGSLRRSVLLTELLPKCVAKRPADVDQTIPIELILDDLEIQDYDALAVALTELISENAALLDDEKKTT